MLCPSWQLRGGPAGVLAVTKAGSDQHSYWMLCQRAIQLQWKAPGDEMMQASWVVASSDM